MASDGLCSTPNTFQRLMLQWERLAPYNAGQYATLCLDLDHGSVRDAWREMSVSLGLQQIGQRPDADVADVLPDLPSFITTELNRAYTAGDSPFRPFMQRRGGQTHVGMIYRHVVADSASVRLVMRGWLERLLRRTIDSPVRGHVTLDQSALFRWFDLHRPWSLVRELTNEFSRLSRAKRMRRLPATSNLQSLVAWRRVDFPDGLVHRLTKVARRLDAKLNDLFVTAAAQVCDAHMPHEDVEARRDLGLGTIADVRPKERDAHRHFGLSLGFLQTVFRPRDLLDVRRALRVAAAQARIGKQRHAAEASIVRFWAALSRGNRLSTEELATFYRKRCPLSAGISNVNLNRDWPRLLHPEPLLSYTRVSPLGPMLPLVFTPTTLGDTLHLGVTYRTSVLDEATADRVITQFMHQLQRWAD